ncbi:class I SAM-dependent rRNA methyltransferase [Bacilli bacterium]|uniref:class I SAM-dependent rRNA methyltransferase n=1 Tax=Oceanobacillus TaxID=182709 RepID=UPI000622B14C|nr:50S rRNA methyltransferase [Bacilli bacterium VT-13-104]PZD85158.1 class I SAM-dependent rRNA methyltransferase [Bacilli bacterium]PZD86739.1 class I SAM-dependent rRNA methyltransferase [Bacilli bacterium]PZD90115.1 class I SAM-dependent rRNA methyltransferase [Bacilli bacterium]RCO05286.1 class I SAM-dependent rRNA methyltransferase [Bacilli bacterium]
MKPIELKVKASYINQYQRHFPLINKDTIINSEDIQKEGSIIHLVEPNGKFIAKGYYGKQNKGLGWVLSDKQHENIDFSFFKKKISNAIDKRKAFFQDENTNAFRIFNGEGDGIGGITIDYYDGYYVINWYSEGAYSFKETVIDVLDEIGEYKAIYEKKRFDTKGKYINDDDFVKGERGEFPIIVKENGMNYAVYLNDGAMVGIFLDQRNVRKIIRDKYAKGKNVLNTFSYTGAFSVAAALGGAKKTTSVDLAKRSKSKTIEQFSTNGIDFEEQDIIVMDVFDYFKYANRKNLVFDLVILDPPSFARSKKRTFSTAKDYPSLIKDTIAITGKGGIIVASTNNASFSMKKFKGFIDKGFKDSKTKYKILEEFSLPSDFQVDRNFPQGNYLKVVILEKLSH